MDRQQDEQDVEFEAFLRQFQPRTPPALKAGRRVAPTTLMIAAVVLLACAIPLRLLRDKPAAQNSPVPVEVGPRPRPADAVNKVASPSSPGAATPALIAGSPRPGVVAQNGPLRVGGTIKPPIRLVNVNPVYPEDAQAAHVEGVVILQITIGEDGPVTNARVLRSIPMLDQAAIDAVLQWVYEPTLLNGVPVEVEMDAYINFTLR